MLPVATERLARCLDAVSRSEPSGSELIVAFEAGTPLRPSSPLRRGSALELVMGGRGPEGTLARYPRLRLVDIDAYAGDVASYLTGVNALATLHRGVGAPALAHLRLL